MKTLSKLITVLLCLGYVVMESVMACQQDCSSIPPSSPWNQKGDRKDVRTQVEDAAVILRLRAMAKKNPSVRIKDPTGSKTYSIPLAIGVVHQAMESGQAAYRLDESLPDGPRLTVLVDAHAPEVALLEAPLAQFDYSHWEWDSPLPNKQQTIWRETPDDWEEVQQILGAQLIDPAFIKSKDLEMVLRSAIVLSKEQAIDLAFLTRKRNGVARMILAQSMGRYIETRAHRIASVSGMPADVLMKAGLTGALRAAELYDPKPGKDATFYGYARYWVEEKMRAAEAEYFSEKLNIPMSLAWYVRPYRALKAKLQRHPTVEEMTTSLRARSTYLSAANAELLSEIMRRGFENIPRGKDNVPLEEDRYRAVNIFVAPAKTSEHVWHLEDPFVEKIILRLSLATGMSRKEWTMYMLYKENIKTDKIRGLAGYENIGALFGHKKQRSEQVIKKLQAYMNSHPDGIAAEILMELAKTTVETENQQEFFSAQVLEHERIVRLLLHRLQHLTKAPVRYWEMYLLHRQLISAYEFRKEGLSIKTIGKAYEFSTHKTTAILQDLNQKLAANPKAQRLLEDFAARGNSQWEDRTWREDDPAMQDLMACLAIRTGLTKVAWCIFFANEGMLEADSAVVGALAQKYKVNKHRAAEYIHDAQRALRQDPALGRWIANRLILSHFRRESLVELSL